MKKPAAAKSNDDMLTAIELANLAAILRPKARPAAAMKAAMEWYVEAVIFCGDYGSKTFEELFDQFGSEERHRAQIVGNLERELKAMREDTLEFDPAKNDDPARQFLTEIWPTKQPPKTARAVLENVRRYWDRPQPGRPFSIPSADSMLAKCRRGKGGKTTYLFPKLMLEGVAAYMKERGRESKRKSWETRDPAKRRSRTGDELRRSLSHVCDHDNWSFQWFEHERDVPGEKPTFHRIICNVCGRFHDEIISRNDVVGVLKPHPVAKPVKKNRVSSARTGRRGS